MAKLYKSKLGVLLPFEMEPQHMYCQSGPILVWFASVVVLVMIGAHEHALLSDESTHASRSACGLDST